MDGTGLVGVGSTSSGGGTRTEDLVEIGWSIEVDGGGYFQETESGSV